MRFTWISRRIVIGLAVLLLALGALLFQPTGVGGSPGWPGSSALLGCRGEHFPDGTLTS
ncbi:MAG: hypothetical protein ACRD1H_18420 [Vicinamibacterales bacterium]